MRTRAPRVMIAGTNSGSGKTTITCGILKLLLQHRRKPVAFKCGPDYIDPMFHRSVLEMDESNLDLFLFERELAKYLIVRNMKDGNIGVIEGVMGFYDGVGEDGLQCSTYEVAKSVNSPVIIIVPSYGLSTSALAIVKGFLSYQPDSNIKGVIFNQMHRSVYENIKQIWDNYECEGEKPQLLGYVESIPEELQFESRHLGLITAMEIQELKDKLDKLANILDKTIDIEKIISIAESAEELEVLEDDYWVVQSNHEHDQKKRVRIAIAKDQAFCFYYKDNLELLESMGAELIPFSPITDQHLPEDISGLILGGGYPELYLEQLEQNESIKIAIYEALTSGLPCIAECGGFMYLNQTIDGKKMVGYLQGHCANEKHLVRFGYTQLTAKENNMLCSENEVLRAHEFHYYDCTNNGDSYQAKKLNGTIEDSIVANDRLYAGYPHIHFYSNLQAARNYIDTCRKYKK